MFTKSLCENAYSTKNLITLNSSYIFFLSLTFLSLSVAIQFRFLFSIVFEKKWLLTRGDSVQSLNHVHLFVTPWIAARQASLSITNSQSLLKLMSIKLVMPSSRLILCYPLLFLNPIPPTIRVFSGESTSHQVAKVPEFQLQHQSFQWTPRTDLL